MANRMEIYKSADCGMMLEILNGSGCQLVCGDKVMEKLTEKTADEGKEKHVPVIEKIDGGYKVKVGSIPHPMEQEHYIEWIELIAGDKVYRQFLKPGAIPEAEFKIDQDAVTAREHCNKHGLWKGQ